MMSARANATIAVSIWVALFFSVSLALGDKWAVTVITASLIYVAFISLAIRRFEWLGPNWWGSVRAVLFATVLLAGLTWWGKKASFAALTQELGAGAVAFLALACMVPIGSSLVRATHKFGFPVIWTLVIWMAIAGFWGDNHAVRRLSATPPVIGDRPKLEDAASAWFKCVSPDGASIPMVVVATAGGGSRAALWTGTVLGLAEDYLPQDKHEFAKHLFALSGVSGGAVGLAFTVAHLREVAHLPIGHRPSLAALNMASIRPDFLSSVVAGMMFPDLIYQLIPFPELPDRAKALELSWEYGWVAAYGSVMPSTPGLTTRFEKILPYRTRKIDADREDCPQPENGGPVLLFNGTHQETGRRILTTNVKIDSDTFVDALDFETLSDGPIFLSTAAHNTARFPYVSPAGTLYKPADGQSLRGHILDGGYYENYGAQTAAEALDAVAPTLEGKIKPIVILISSDPDLRFEDIDPVKCYKGPDAEEAGVRWANDARAPLEGLFATRSARGVAAAKYLCAQTARYGNRPVDDPLAGVFVHFRMCRVDKKAVPELTWKLSPASQDFITNVLPCECGNDIQFERLFEAFGEKEAHEKVRLMCDSLSKGMRPTPPVVEAPPALPPAQITLRPAVPAAPPRPERQFLAYFESNKAEISEEVHRILQQIATLSNEDASLRIVLVGKADLTGGDDYNLDLSKRRAEEVCRALRQIGVTVSRVETRWVGKSEPRVPTLDGVHEPRNRVVEVNLDRDYVLPAHPSAGGCESNSVDQGSRDRI